MVSGPWEAQLFIFIAVCHGYSVHGACDVNSCVFVIVVEPCWATTSVRMSLTLSLGLAVLIDNLFTRVFGDTKLFVVLCIS